MSKLMGRCEFRTLTWAPLFAQEVTLQNASAWATLTEKPDEDAGPPGRGDPEAAAGGAAAAAAAGDDGDEDGKGAVGDAEDEDDDNLWAEFQTREEQQHARVSADVAADEVSAPCLFSKVCMQDASGPAVLERRAGCCLG